MITGLILICVFETKECTVNVGAEFYTTVQECELSLEQLKEYNNSKDVPFIIAEHRCVAWGETL